VVTSGGEVFANPRFLRAKERKLGRAQRSLARKNKGSVRRVKARHRVAVIHREVRAARLDHAHKTALRLVRDNQAVYAEDLCVSGLKRTRMAKSVADAGWSQLLRLIEEKAAYYGREFFASAGGNPRRRFARHAGSRTVPRRSKCEYGSAPAVALYMTVTSMQRRTSWRPDGPTD